jgi:dTDP-4-dehydrorhamnose reductase
VWTTGNQEKGQVEMSQVKILVLGATGMLGNAMVRYLSRSPRYEVYGSVRGTSAPRIFDAKIAERVVPGVDVEQQDSLVHAFTVVKPDIVVNCIGLIKQLAAADDPLRAIPINSILPHRLAALCELAGARLVHVSTDCVFSGAKGNYLESDASDAKDLYGRSKYLGEPKGAHTITLRTSIIGPELNGGAHALLDWFLSQQGTVRGYTRAIFSGLPTVELARVVDEFVIPRSDLSGLYHVAADPISKFDLLSLIADIYGKTIEITPVAEPAIDRSLDGGRFNAATGYRAPAWRELVSRMFNFK